MSDGDPVWIGADPGGKDNFGVAVLQASGAAYTCCVSCADEAMSVVRERVENAPSGVGVDAPLWWSSGAAGRRKVDAWLRATYGLSGGQVQSPNSLQGATLAQGMLFVQRTREQFGGVLVTETHPKALLVALRMPNNAAFWKRFSVCPETERVSEHERDALISAVAARQGSQKCWTNDLSLSRNANEQDPSRHWLAPVHYFWPEGEEEVS